MKKTKPVSLMMAYMALVSLIIPSLSFAEGNPGKRSIDRVELHAQRHIKIWGEAAWLNPDACDSSGYIVVPATINGNENPNYSEAYVMVLTAFYENKQITGRVKNCINLSGNTRPMLRDVRVVK